MKRTQKIYVGDVGEIVPKRLFDPTPLVGIDLNKMDYRSLCAILLEVGIEVKDIIGIKSCKEHDDMVPVGDYALPHGFNLFEHCNYCLACFTLFRLVRI